MSDPNNHHDLLIVLRQKVDQLGRVAASQARDDAVGAVLALRSDITRLFDHLGVRPPHSKRGLPLVEVLTAPRRHD